MTAAAQRVVVLCAVGAVLGPPGRAVADDGPAIGSDEELIEDPELAGEPLAVPAPEAAPAPTPGAAPAGIVRLSAEARLGVDTDWDRARGEDVAVHRVRLDAEVSQHLGTRARALVAGRVEHRARARPGELPGHVGGELEARLLDAWLDARLGFADLRVGNQVIPWGRVSVLSPGAVWNPPDLRDPFVEMDALPVVPVPALRLDARPVAGLGVSLVWQPLFVPMRADLLGTDQALLGPGAPPALRGLAEPLARLYGDDVVLPIDDPALGTSTRGNLADSQVGARLTAALGEAELGATVFWGRSKIPTVELSDELRAAIDAGPDDPGAWLGVLGALAEGRPLLRSRYERNLQLVVDAEAPAGDVLVGFELGWAPRRALYTIDDAGCRASCVVHRGVVEAAAQIERVAQDWQVVVEALVVAADRGVQGQELLFFGAGRTVVGAVATLRWAPWAADWEIGGSAVVLSPGPSATMVGRLARRLGDHLRVEIGGIVTASTADSALAPGDGADMVFLAARVTN